MTRTRKRILQSGLSRSAKVIRYKPSVFKLGKHAGSKFMQGVDLWLEVHCGQADNHVVKTRSVIHVSEFSKIRVGMLVGVKIDPENQKRVVVDAWSVDQVIDKTDR